MKRRIAILAIVVAFVGDSAAIQAEDGTAPAISVEQRIALLEARVTKLEAALQESKIEASGAEVGVPASVMAKIRAAAIKEAPDDFAYQKWEINKQVNAWKELHSVK